jgi:putative endonuclease
VTDSRSAGARFEQFAAEFLQGKGYRILERNLRLARKEVDIVAADGDTIVFVEVKGRSSALFGTAAEAVGPRKQTGLARFAAAYLERNGLWSRACRFDVVAVGLSGGEPVFEHIENAFGA